AHASLVAVVAAPAQEHGPAMADGDGARTIGLGEHREGHGAIDELESGEGHAVAALGRVLGEAAHQAEETHLGRGGAGGELRRRGPARARGGSARLREWGAGGGETE